MADLEKVIKALACCQMAYDCKPYEKCPYSNGSECVDCDINRLHYDAIALLKEQEAVTIKKTKEHGFGVYGGICPKCNNWIQSAHSFCGFCGQAVKWE